MPVTKRRTAAARSPRRASVPASPSRLPAASGVGHLFTLARQVRSWADSMVSMAEPAAHLAIAAAGTRVEDPEQRAMIHQAGAALRHMREAAGLMLADVTKAVHLRDPALLERAEGGAVALPFEVILRLAPVLGRDDPVTRLAFEMAVDFQMPTTARGSK